MRTVQGGVVHDGAGQGDADAALDLEHQPVHLLPGEGGVERLGERPAVWQTGESGGTRPVTSPHRSS